MMMQWIITVTFQHKPLMKHVQQPIVLNGCSEEEFPMKNVEMNKQTSKHFKKLEKYSTRPD